MSLTVTQAQQAGALAVQAISLQSNIAAIQTALTGSALIENLSVSTTVGVLTSTTALSSADSATLLNCALGIFQNMLSSVTTQLQGM